MKNRSKIGDIVEAGQVLAVIEGEDGSTEVSATIDGLLRGLIRDDYPVTKGFKIADIDPRKEELANCFTISAFQPEKSHTCSHSKVSALIAFCQVSLFMSKETPKRANFLFFRSCL